EGGGAEREADKGGPEPAATRPAEVDRERGGEGPRRELRERGALLVILGRNPAPLLHGVALHVPAEGDRTAEADGAEPQEVAEQIGQRVCARLGRADGSRWAVAHLVALPAASGGSMHR